MPSDFCMGFSCLFSNVFLAILLLIVSSNPFFVVEAKNGGFMVDLIHRDSPNSPFYKPSSTHFQRQKHAFHRSLVRVNQFASTSVFPDGGEYLVKISYGTPPVDTLAIVDTGSDVTWTQCLPCTNCYKEKYPPFNPNRSSTFKFIPCRSRTCQGFPRTNCGPTPKTCVYKEVYGDNSYTHGDVAAETISFGGSKQGTASFPKFIFGCGHDNGGVFPYQGSGLVGFGFGKQSLVSQLSSSIKGKFSYCFGPSNEVSKPGKLNLGENALISGDGVVSTPLFLGLYYTLTVEGITVDDKKLVYPNASRPSNNIIIDSGTTYTFLPTKLYMEFESTMKKKIKSQNIVPDPQKILGLCYSSLDCVQIPKVTINFKGADLKLNPVNIFISTSPSSMCLAFVPTDDVNIVGNVQQTNFWVGYDLKNKFVSFKPADCTK